MKSRFFFAAVLLSLFLTGTIFATPDNVDWESFSKNLTAALKSDNSGLQQSAMCMIIQYADNVKVPRDAIFEIVKVFRSHDNENVRLLALVALYKTQDPWAMDYLQRHRRYEQESRIKKLCCCAVNTYYAKMDSLKAEKAEKILAQTQEKLVKDKLVKTAQASQSK